MDNREKIYVATAFTLGALLTLGFKDFYPDLEWRFLSGRKKSRTLASAWFEGEGGIKLEDHTDIKSLKASNLNIPEGVASCVGNTPLFRIKSLSDETGCDILAKAEVSTKLRNFELS